MGRLHIEERQLEYKRADNVIMLDCPTCGWYGDVYYSTCPPKYCSDKCKQAAYRERKRKGVTGNALQVRQSITNEWKQYGFSDGTIAQLHRLREKHGYDAACMAIAIVNQVVTEVRNEVGL